MKNKIVFIMADTLRWDMLNCARETGIQTPNLDRLAAQGIRFNQAYTTQAVCQPARAGIFTGMYPHSSGGWSNSVGIGDNVHTIGERLNDLGVHTAYIGKWHLDGSDYFGLGKPAKGWDKDYWYDQRNYTEELTDEEKVMSRATHTMDTHDIDEEFTYGHKCSNKAIDFIEKHSEEEYLLVVSYDEPHHPNLCPRRFHEKYVDFNFPKDPNVYDTLDNKPDFQKVWAGQFYDQDKDALKINNKYYFGCVEFVDYEIGRVLEAIETYAKDATVFFTSDHGTMLFSHCLTLKGPVGYDEITKIPFIVKGKKIAKGVVEEAIVSHIDIAPTIFDLFGKTKSKSFAGKSLIPLLHQEVKKINDNIFFEFGRVENNQDYMGGLQLLRGTFDGTWKLVINLLSTDELYNLKDDPYEMNNLINDLSYLDVAKKLQKAILDMMNDTRDPFRGYYWEYRYWRTDLKTPPLWYEGYMRQREEEYEPRQLLYKTGLPMKEPVRKAKAMHFYS